MSATQFVPRWIALGGVSTLLLVAAGCATKNYVRNQTTPIIQQTNELEDQTAANHRNLQDVDSRAQKGIQQAQTAASTADQKAIAAGQSATQAQQSAQEALNHADSLASVVSNLDTYHQVADAQVHFGFNKSTLTAKDKQELDTFAGQLANAKSYILEITGGTDSVGSKDYNYQLSEMRAEAVAQYLATKYNVPAHKFYLIGIGKDDEVSSNRTAAGRAKNRRVEIQMLSNSTQTGAPQQGTANADQGSMGAPASASQPNATGQTPTMQPAAQTTGQAGQPQM